MQQEDRWADLQPLVLGRAVDEGRGRPAAGVLLPVLLQVGRRLAGALSGAASRTALHDVQSY